MIKPVLFLLPLLGLTLTTLTACGDKDTADKLDTATDDDTESSDDTNTDDTDDITDTGPSFTDRCAVTATPSAVFGWDFPDTANGYSFTSTADRWLITDYYAGLIYAVDWSANSGAIETRQSATFFTQPMSDKLTRWGDLVTISDAGRGKDLNGDGTIDYDTEMIGGVYILSAETINTATGTNDASVAAALDIEGVKDHSYTGTGFFGDVNGDGLRDFITQSVADQPPLPGALAVFFNIDALLSAGGQTTLASADLIMEVCSNDYESDGDTDNNVAYASTSIAVFGDNDGNGYLAAGCPGLGYNNGAVAVTPMPIHSASDWEYLDQGDLPASPSGWYITSLGIGYPLVIDSRGDDSLVTLEDTSIGWQSEVYTSPAETGTSRWFGASPVVWQREVDGELCSYLAVGANAYKDDKATETGAVFVAVLDELGQPAAWQHLSLPTSEGIEAPYAGAVLSVSGNDGDDTQPMGDYLGASGWQKGAAGTPGGAHVWALTYGLAE